MIRFFVLIGLCLLSAIVVQAQLLPPLQPEQEACNALRLCGSSFTTPYSYQGYGATNDLFGTPCSGGENHSVWIRLEVAAAGTIVFTISPVSPEDDYDFAVLDVTGIDCADLVPTQVIRCNFNNNSPGSNVNGVVGLNTTSTINNVSAGYTGNSFCQQITAEAGGIYFVMINNFGNYVSGGVSSGFTIDFSGSTATFVSEPPPVYDSLAAVPCGSIGTLTVFLDRPVLCSSIAADGSDFQLSPSITTVVAAAGANCSGGYGYTQEVTLNFADAVPAGMYSLQAAVGTDGNTLLNICGVAQQADDSIRLYIAGPLVNAGPDTTTCTGDSLQLSAVIGGSGVWNSQVQWTPATYLDDPFSLQPLCTPTADMTYVLTVTPNDQPECASSDTVQVRVLEGFILLNPDTAICIGAEVPLQISGDMAYHYSWTPTSGLSDPLIPNPVATPDSTTTYVVTASYPGCSDTAQSVVIMVDTAIPEHMELRTDRKAVCLGEAILFDPFIDVTPLRLSWDFGDGSFLPADSQPVSHAYDQSGVFPVTFTAGFLACPDVSFTDTVYVYIPPEVNLGADTSLCLGGHTVVLHNLAAAPDEPYHQLWSTGDTTANLRVLQPGTYSLRISTDPLGCTTTDIITVHKDCYADIPNAFTPNGDGDNDYFFPRTPLSKSVGDFKMQVFSRWGQLVFETNRIDGLGWDGRLNGKEQPQGVYIYVIDVAYSNDRQEQYEGNVTLIR